MDRAYVAAIAAIVLIAGCVVVCSILDDDEPAAIETDGCIDAGQGADGTDTGYGPTGEEQGKGATVRGLRAPAGGSEANAI